MLTRESAGQEIVKMDAPQVQAMFQQQGQFPKQTVEQQTKAQALGEKESMTSTRAFTMLPNITGRRNV